MSRYHLLSECCQANVNDEACCELCGSFAVVIAEVR